MHLRKRIAAATRHPGGDLCVPPRLAAAGKACQRDRISSFARWVANYNHGMKGQADSHPPAADFATTQWSLVLGAQDRPGAEQHAALAALCQRYWYPLYAFVRRRGAQASDAQELTQEFFVRLLEKNAIAAASPDRGRFRGFLLASMMNFLANQHDRRGAQKRGGDRQLLSLDLAAGESRYHIEPTIEMTPERWFDRQWALTLLAEVMQQLEREQADSGKGRQFELLRGALAGEANLDYTALAAQLEITEPAVRQAVSRLRKRYRQLLRSEVAATLEEPGEVDDEIQSLFAALAVH